VGITKDWTGNGNSIYKTLGASNHTDEEREANDYYATDPEALEVLLEREKFSPYIWECACGGGHLSKVLEDNCYNVKSSDIIDRGYEGTEIIDFLKVAKEDIKNDFSRDIITNPPYKYAKEFVEHALDISMDSVKVAMFLKLTFLEGQARKKLFKKYPPKTIYVFSRRVICAKNGDFKNVTSSAVAYAWFIWEKGFTGQPVIKWI
jgi:hypothetical protein